MVPTALAALIRIFLFAAALSGGFAAASAADGPLIDPDVRAAIAAGRVRVLVDLRASSGDASAIASVQDEALRRLAGTDARVARRFSTAPLLALEIGGAALTRLETMRDIVARVRADRIVPPNAERSPGR
jgi:hypothetical protein